MSDANLEAAANFMLRLQSLPGGSRPAAENEFMRIWRNMESRDAESRARESQLRKELKSCADRASKLESAAACADTQVRKLESSLADAKRELADAHATIETVLAQAHEGSERMFVCN